MEEYKSAIEIMVSIFSIIGSIWAAASFLISKWAKKTQEIEKLKGSLLTKDIDQLENTITDHKKTINIMQKQLQDTREELARASGKMDVATMRAEEAVSAVKEFSQDTQSRIKMIEADMDSGELVALGKGRVAFRGKRIKAT